MPLGGLQIYPNNHKLWTSCTIEYIHKLIAAFLDYLSIEMKQLFNLCTYFRS